MVIVKTILGSFDTSTQSFLKEPKKQITPIQEAFKSFKLVTAPPRIINVTRFGGQVFQEVKRATSVPRQGVRTIERDPELSRQNRIGLKRFVPSTAPQRRRGFDPQIESRKFKPIRKQESIREIFNRRRRRN